MSFPFNVRAYGALILDGSILLSNEKYQNIQMIKLPGGGLEFGEGLHDCLIREFLEEAGLDIHVQQHIYTTDFFQQSAFNKEDQLISVYYQVRPVRSSDLLSEINSLEDNKHFFWKELKVLSEDDFTFPVDKHVCALLMELK